MVEKLIKIQTILSSEMFRKKYLKNGVEMCLAN